MGLDERLLLDPLLDVQRRAARRGDGRVEQFSQRKAEENTSYEEGDMDVA